MEPVNPSTDCNMAAANHRNPTKEEAEKFDDAFQNAFGVYKGLHQIIPLILYYHHNTRELFDKLCVPSEGRELAAAQYSDKAKEILRITDVSPELLEDTDENKMAIIDKIRRELVNDPTINRAFIVIEVDATVVDTKTMTIEGSTHKMLGCFWYEIGKPVLTVSCPMSVSPEGVLSVSRFGQVSEIVDGNLHVSLPENIRELF